MKKLMTIFFALGLTMAVYSQTGTIVDNESYFQINYHNGDTVVIGKDRVIYLRSEKETVFIVSSTSWGSDKITKLVSVSARDFGFASTTALRDYLSKICFRAYSVTYTYNGSGNLSTVSNYIGDSLMFTINYTYDGSTITSKSAPTH